jgi:hypothetical protein
MFEKGFKSEHEDTDLVTAEIWFLKFAVALLSIESVGKSRFPLHAFDHGKRFKVCRRRLRFGQ